MRTAWQATALVLMLMTARVAHAAQETPTTLSLAPHCDAADRSTCPSFAPSEDGSMQTSTMAIGDILDVDIVLSTANPGDVGAVRSWLSYDPKVLEARNLDVSSLIDTPYPGERDIDARMGLIKIGGEINAPLTDESTTVARVTFRVIAGTENGLISFHLFRSSGDGNTAVTSRRNAPRTSEAGGLADPPCITQLVGCKERKIALLLSEPAHLALVIPVPQVQTVAAESPAATEPPMMQMPGGKESTPSEGSTTPIRSAFHLLQITGLGITTKGNDVYLGWTKLPSPDLASYNVYYGTTPGQYMLRRSIPGTMESLTIRDLPQGTTYYAAIRGVNGAGEETAFSREVSVTVGSPETASAAIVGRSMLTGVQQREISSLPRTNQPMTESGGPSWILAFVGVSALVGTALAVRRRTGTIDHRPFSSSYHV